MKKSVLIVEDNTEVQVLLKRALHEIDSDLYFASTVSQAKEYLSNYLITLILLDISLPDQDGFELFTKMQSDERLKAIPVIFLTGKDDVSTKVAAFAMGAEDYIVKPFNALELRARVNSKLKRVSSHADSKQILQKGILQLDAATQRAFTLFSGENNLIHLTPREFKLLFHLAKNEETVFSRGQLLKVICKDSEEVFDRTVDTHISTIRKKLGKIAVYIESIPGSGYRFSSARKTIDLG